MKKIKTILLATIILIATLTIVTPQVQVRATADWNDTYLNVLDSSGGNTGWSPVYRLRNNEWRWNQYWSSSYRHYDLYQSTPYGQGTRLRGDRQSTADTAPKAFYQYRKLNVGLSSYTLHLDFYLKEDSSTTASSVDNWEIIILDAQHNSWQDPLFREQFPNCPEHNNFQLQSFDITLDDPEIYLLIGHWDSWSADWDQGHTKFFNEISAESMQTVGYKDYQNLLCWLSYLVSGYHSSGSYADTLVSDNSYHIFHTGYWAYWIPYKPIKVEYYFGTSHDENDFVKLTVKAEAKTTAGTAYLEIYDYDSQTFESVTTFGTTEQMKSFTFTGDIGRFINSYGDITLRWQLTGTKRYLKIDYQEIILDEFDERWALIVCGGGAVGDFNQDDFEYAANSVYSNLTQNFGYNDDHIMYLNVETGHLGVDGYADAQGIETAITCWLASKSTSVDKIFIYFVDHGSFETNEEEVNGLFYTDSNQDGDIQDPCDEINSNDLANWLSSLSYKTLIFVLECCHSGEFVEDLSQSDRIIITSADYTKAYPGDPNHPAFSDEFFYRLQEGDSLCEAFNGACYAVIELVWKFYEGEYLPEFRQTPMLNDDGNTVGSSAICFDAENQSVWIEELPRSGEGLIAVTTGIV